MRSNIYLKNKTGELFCLPWIWILHTGQPLHHINYTSIAGHQYVYSAAQNGNPGSPNGPPMVKVWVVRIFSGWSATFIEFAGVLYA